MGLVERANLGEMGVARAEDFTEIAFVGEAPTGEITDLRVTGHDGRKLLAAVAFSEAAE